jgi:hypothetical protein
MDMRLFGRVVWRFKILIACAFVLAFVLAILSMSQVSFKGGLSLRSRTPTFYKADALLFVTQHGFPWGYADQPYRSIAGTATPVPHGDQPRLTNLAQVFAEYANSDSVAGVLRRRGLIGAVDAEPVTTNPNVGAPTLPLIDISGTAASKAGAQALAQGATDALVAYVEEQAAAADIPISRRVMIQQLHRPKNVVVVQKPKKTVPILVFMTVMLAGVGLAFVLENLRPRPAPKAVEQDDDGPLLLTSEPRQVQGLE